MIFNNNMLAWIISFLGSSEAKYIFVPLMTILITIIIELFSQNDKYEYPIKNLFFWGPSLVTSSLVLLFVECSEQFSEMTSGVPDSLVLLKAFIAFIMCLVLIATMLFAVRKKGWKTPKIGLNPELCVWWGIILPDLIGLLALGVVYFLMK